MDGVLADMDAALARIAEQEFGVTAKSRPGSRRRAPARPSGDTGAEDRRGRRRRYDTAVLNCLDRAAAVASLAARPRHPQLLGTLDECEPGIVRRIQKLAHELRWDVLFVTQRPSTAGRTQQLQTQHWLRRRGFEYPRSTPPGLARAHRGVAHPRRAHRRPPRSTAWTWRRSRRPGRSSSGATPSRSIASAPAPPTWVSPPSARWPRPSTGSSRPTAAASQQEQPTLLDRLRRSGQVSSRRHRMPR